MRMFLLIPIMFHISSRVQYYFGFSQRIGIEGKFWFSGLGGDYRGIVHGTKMIQREWRDSGWI
jgi:hypothetical protein